MLRDQSMQTSGLTRWARPLAVLPILSGTLVCTVLAIAALVGSVDANFDVFTHFAPLYLVGAAIGLLLCTFLPPRARVITATAALVGLGACVGLMAPEYLAVQPRAGPGAARGDFKVIEFNAWGGNRSPQRALAWLLAQNADAIILEEGGSVQYDLVKLGGYHLSCGNCYAQILTKVQPTWTNTPANWRIPPEEVSVVLLADPRGEIAILAVHRSWAIHPRVFEPQMADLAHAVAKFPVRDMIIAGDFNSTSWSFARRREDKTLGLIRRTRGLFTWPADRVSHNKAPASFPVLPIDHVYAGPGWATVRVERGPKLGSDHYPVIVTLRRIPAATAELVIANPSTEVR